MAVPLETRQRLNWIDVGLVIVFLIGIYLGVSLPISERIPLPAAPAGFAGLIMLVRRRNDITPVHLGALFAIILLYLCSILSASDYWYLSKRFTGFVQISYSLIISYALFLTLVKAERNQIAKIFLWFCLVIVVGCVLEQYGGLRAISDQVRRMIYDFGIYESDLRDEILYGRVRPKLFTSEPSAVTIAYTLYGFAWYAISPWRWKLLGYLALIGVGLAAMPGPTLLLMMILIVPYELFLAGRSDGQPSRPGRLFAIAALSLVIVCAAAWIGSVVYAERLRSISLGDDPSFFYRVTGPMYVAFDVIRDHPWAGAGLTGEAYIADLAINAFMKSPTFSTSWLITRIADVITNYFWLHWIYLGLIWGTVMIIAIAFWLRLIGVPSALFCWMVWAIMGQASGAYVGPKTWAILFIAGAAAVLVRRQQPMMYIPVEDRRDPLRPFPLLQPGRGAAR
ncbi:MAG TPA: hypothetical protein VIM38_02245 [Alphaproteobacteria bacterium]